MRLHELAKELGADGKRLLDLAKDLGLGVKSHSSNLAKGIEGILRAAWAEDAREAAANSAPKEAPKDDGVSLTIPVRASAEPAPAPEVVEPEVDVEPKAEPVAPMAVVDPAPVAAAAPAPAPEVPAEPVVEPAPTVVVTPAPAATETPTPAEPAPTEPVVERRMVVTIGGEKPGAEAQRQAEAARGPEETQPEEATPRRREVASAGATSREAETKVLGRPNVPTSRERKGAKVLGKIDLKKVDTERPRRSPAPTQAGAGPVFDPLDPTRAVPTRGRHAPDSSRDKPDTTETRKVAGRPGKGGGQGGDFVFDPEDNTALSAIRIGHFSNRRRPMVRRPPTRRSRGGPRRLKREGDRPMHPISVRPPVSVRDLADELGIKAREILSYFPESFDPRDKNAVLNADQLLTLAVAIEREIIVLDPDSAEARLMEAEQARSSKLGSGVRPRPPVVAVMGHVDHGKTSLLDYIRKTRVAAKEAGGITQVTSAYSVQTRSGAKVTFLDTPGHKAFTEMRARGASVTDVALLVVAADDGVMEQTQEAIDHARAAGVPMVVAINKIDRSNANAMRVRQQLASVEVLVEDYGGEVGVVECSATTGQGIDELLDRLALETEILELEADADVPARGVVIDARKDSKLGVVVTAVIQQGTLRAKDNLLAGSVVGRVRWLLDDRGQRIESAGPSTPVQIQGFEEPPAAGARLMAVEDVDLARQVAEERKAALVQRHTAAVDAVTLDNLFDTIAAQKVTEINVLLKADNMASLEVLRATVEGISHPEVRFKVIRSGVGGVSEDDVLLASASEALIIGFGVVPDVRARQSVTQTGVEVKYYEVIYEMVDDLEKALEGRLGTESKEDVIGHATVRAIFKVSRLGNIAGCYVTDGIVRRDSQVRLVRDGKVIFTGRLETLRRFKDDVKEVRENYECGMHIANYDDLREGDVIEAYTVTEVKRTLESTAPSAE